MQPTRLLKLPTFPLAKFLFALASLTLLFAFAACEGQTNLDTASTDEPWRNRGRITTINPAGTGTH